MSNAVHSTPPSVTQQNAMDYWEYRGAGNKKEINYPLQTFEIFTHIKTSIAQKYLNKDNAHKH